MITVVYTGQKPPQTINKSIFLAGPTPRDKDTLSWRPDAIKELEKQGYDGVVFYPEFPPNSNMDYAANPIIEWENEHLNMADVIMFWIPRKIRKMPAFTTNVEFGTWMNSGKVVLGFPPSSVKNHYIETMMQLINKESHHETLADTVKTTLERIGEGASRTEGERKVPLQIWQVPAFQNWYQQLKENGNRLDDAKQLWVFKIPKTKGVFSFVLWVKVWITKENRYKENEFVFSRSDIFNVVLFDKETHDVFSKKVVLVKEFRSPVRNKEGFVFECIGGSSFKGGNPIDIAQAELKEETGIEIDPLRFKLCGTRQVASTLSTHHAMVYTAALTREEIRKIEESVKNKTFGVEEDTEKTYVITCKVQDLLDGKIPVDWANIGMILSAIIEEG